MECPLWVKSGKLDLSIRCPLTPRKRTLSDTTGMSALCQNRTYALQQIGPSSITASPLRAPRSGPPWTISRTDPAHEVGHGVANLVGTILLEEMAPFHRHFGLIQLGAAG